MRVEVYFNIRKRCFSVRALEGVDQGKVIAHSNRVLLRDATFVVQAAGRKRVIEEQRKNVHAFVRGDWAEKPQPTAWREVLGPEVTYNPYRHESFVTRESSLPVTKAATVAMVVSTERKPILRANFCEPKDPKAISGLGDVLTIEHRTGCGKTSRITASRMGLFGSSADFCDHCGEMFDYSEEHAA